MYWSSRATIIDAHDRSTAQVKAEAVTQSALALAHATFVAWLGDLADELDIKGPLGRKEWRIRLLAWLLPRSGGRLLAIDVEGRPERLRR